MTEISSIDLSIARFGNQSDEKDISRRIDLACRELGFFTVSGHGMDIQTLEQAHAALKQFFSLPLTEKAKCKADGYVVNSDDYAPYGYSALLEESAFAYMGQLGRPSDYVEKFSVGRRILNDRESLPFIDDATGRELRHKLKMCYLGFQGLAAHIMELFTIPLGLSRDFFARRTDRSNDSMRGHIYPRFSTEFNNSQGMGEHTDGSLITLLTHTLPGIEVQTKNGEWITPASRSVADILVNIGDLMADWTNNAYVSTPHRVVLSDRERQSIAFFKVMNEGEVVDPEKLS